MDREQERKKDISRTELIQEGARFHCISSRMNKRRPMNTALYRPYTAFKLILPSVKSEEKVLGSFVAGVNGIELRGAKRSCAFLATNERLIYGFPRLFYPSVVRSLPWERIEGIKISKAGSLGALQIEAAEDTIQILTSDSEVLENIYNFLYEIPGINANTYAPIIED